MKLLEGSMLKYIIPFFLVFSVFAREISSEDFDSVRQPSVGNIEEVQANKFKKIINDCLANNGDLKNLYKIQSIASYIQRTFNESSKCSDITAELQKALLVQNTLNVLAEDKMCNIEGIDISTMTPQEAARIKDQITSKFNGIATDYTKYFTYTEKIAQLEYCMNYYNNYTIVEEIQKNVNEFTEELQNKQHIVKQNNLKGFYGEKRGLVGLGILSLISDLENKKITTGAAKDYAIFETSPYDWQLSGAMEGYLLYFLQEKYIAIPFVPGVTYSCDKLPYKIFKLEKKIEIPKKEYSIYILEPLD